MNIDSGTGQPQNPQRADTKRWIIKWSDPTKKDSSYKISLSKLFEGAWLKIVQLSARLTENFPLRLYDSPNKNQNQIRWQIVGLLFS